MQSRAGPPGRACGNGQGKGQEGQEEEKGDENRTHFEIDESVLVTIERSEDVVAKLLSIAIREKHFIHVDKFGRCQPAARTILLLDFIQKMRKEKRKC